MQEATAQTDFTIAVLSETYVKSEYTQPEWAAAFAQDPTGKKRKLIPVLVAECALTGMLLPIVHIDLIGLDEPDAKRALLDGLKPSGRPMQPPPFPGKRAEPSISTAPFPPNRQWRRGYPNHQQRVARFTLPMIMVLVAFQTRRFPIGAGKLRDAHAQDYLKQQGVTEGTAAVRN
jgi:hypothetical protein